MDQDQIENKIGIKLNLKKCNMLNFIYFGPTRLYIIKVVRKVHRTLRLEPITTNPYTIHTNMNIHKTQQVKLLTEL